MTEILTRFKELIVRGRLAHAYLFAGPASAGVDEAALALARMVNCASREFSCTQCISCRKISAGSHPDVHCVGSVPEDSIKIEDVRRMLGQAGLRAYEAQVKVFIIRGAQRMTTEAANALLKTLEEPAPNTLMVLTTPSPENCLDTIKSRCHVVKFFSRQENLSQDRDAILDAFLAPGHEDYLKAVMADRALTAEAMRVLLGLVRDAMLHKNGLQRPGLLNKNRMKEIESIGRRSMQELCGLSRQIIKVKSLADENLNARMAVGLLKERLWGN